MKEANETALIGAWYGAALQRQKRLPPLKSLLVPPVTKKLTPEEAAQRKAEHAALSARLKKGKPQT